MSDQEDIENEEVGEEEQTEAVENGAEEANGEAEEGKEGEEEEKAEEEKIPDIPLTEEIMPESLNLLCKIGNGLAHAYVRFDASGKELTDISLLKNFIHLRYIDLSNNNLKDISALNSLTHLLTLKVDFNKLTALKLDTLPYLQQASFNENKIKTIDIQCLPKLETLNLNNNELSSLNDFTSTKYPILETLEIRGNKLTTTKGIKLPKLKSLYLAANNLNKLEDLDDLTLLATLHLRDNKIKGLDDLSENLSSLEYINLRGNEISESKKLRKLHSLQKLKALVLVDNPISSNDDYRLEVLIAVRRLERLDKDKFADEERSEAEEIYEQRRQKELEEANNPTIQDINEQQAAEAED